MTRRRLIWRGPRRLRALAAATTAAATALVCVAPAPAQLPRLTWTRLSVTYPLGAIEEAQGGATGGKLYAFGGYITNGARTGVHAGPLDPLADAYVLDPATNTFARLAPLTTPPVAQPFTHAGTTTDGHSWYFVGGMVRKVPNDPRSGVVDGSKAVYRYDIATNTYSRLPDLPRPRAAGAAIVLPTRGELHFIGGTDPDSQASGTDYRDHWVLDLHGGSSWTPAPPVPDDPDHPGWGLNHVGYTAYADRIYLFGGQHLLLNLLTTTARSWCYDPATGRWTRLADLPVPRSHISGPPLPSARTSCSWAARSTTTGRTR